MSLIFCGELSGLLSNEDCCTIGCLVARPGQGGYNADEARCVGSAFFIGLTGDIRENEAVMAKAYKLGKKLAAGG